MKPKNEMTVDVSKMMFPKAKWLRPAKSPTMRPEATEANLQIYANAAIELRGWSYLRFPDIFMGWIKMNAPPYIQKTFFGQVGGRMPDNLILVPIASGMFLSAKMELKTRDTKGRAVGRLHGRQKRYAESEGWFIARSPEEINAVLDRVEKMSEKIKIFLAQ